MPARGVHFALSSSQYRSVCACSSDTELVELIQEDIEDSWDEEWLCETDKSWDAIHRSLTDGKLEWSNGSFPLNAAILGGKQLHQSDNYIMSLVTANEVNEVSKALTNVDKSLLKVGYEKIVQSDYDGEIGSEDFEYTWDYFEALVAFYAKASKSERAVLFSVAQ